MTTPDVMNIVVALIVASATINWGLVAGFNWDLFEFISFGSRDAEWYIKIIVALVGVYYAYLFYTWYSMAPARA